MPRPSFTHNPIRRAVDAYRPTPKETPMSAVSVAQLNEAIALQAVQAAALLNQLSQLTVANQQLAQEVQARDKTIADLRAIAAAAAKPEAHDAVERALPPADASEGGSAD